MMKSGVDEPVKSRVRVKGFGGEIEWLQETDVLGVQVLQTFADLVINFN